MPLPSFRRRRDRHAEARAEIESHLRMASRDRLEAGELPGEAQRQAHLELGSARVAIEESRAVWTSTRLEQLWRDLRSGARILTRSPGLSAATVALIALVIGGNTTIYSAVRGMLTKPAPGVRADGLVSIGWTTGDDPVVAPDTTLAHYQAIATNSRLLQAAAFRSDRITLTHDAGTYALNGESVSTNYFDTLGIPIIRGRTFSEADAGLGADGLVAVISERVWRQHFGAAEDVVGRSVMLNGLAATIIGILPAPFQGAWTAEGTGVWLPLVAYARAAGAEKALHEPGAIHAIVARRLSDASRAAAEAEVRAIAERASASEPANTPKQVPRLVDYTGVAARDNQIALEGPRFLSIFAIITLLTVVIVCANVANLMLARAVARQREIAVRQSFGASRTRIARMLLAEGLTIAVAAWVVACVFAFWMSSVLPGIIPPSHTGGSPAELDFTPDWNVLGYAMALALAAAVSCTVAPAIRTWRQDLLSFLKAGERGVAPGRGRASQVLVVLQLAFSVVLLIGAGLGYRSLAVIKHADLGYATDQLLLITVDLTTVNSEARLAAADAMLERLRAVPAVRDASYASFGPSTSWPRRDARLVPGADPVRVEWVEVGPGYLRTLGLRPAQGTEFGTVAGSAGRHEAIVNGHLAEALWPGVSPLGRTLILENVDEPITIVGVAPNALVGGYRRDPRPRLVYLSSRQAGEPIPNLMFSARYAGSLDDVVPAVGRAFREAAPTVPLIRVSTLQLELDDISWLYRTLTLLLALFACGSLLIAALGQYAAMAFAMRQRVRDFAIRLAVGASAPQILLSALKDGLLLTAIGLALGFALGIVAGRAGERLLHGITPTDAATYTAVLLLLGLASLAACYLPAFRASRVNPIDALRAE